MSNICSSLFINQHNNGLGNDLGGYVVWWCYGSWKACYMLSMNWWADGLRCQGVFVIYLKIGVKSSWSVPKKWWLIDWYSKPPSIKCCKLDILVKATRLCRIPSNTCLLKNFDCKCQKKKKREKKVLLYAETLSKIGSIYKYNY